MSLPALLLLLGSGWAADLLVPAEYDTIQAAIDAAEDGDVVHVDPDVYFENLDFQGKTIELIGSDDPIDTVIDGSDQTLGAAFGSVIAFSGGEGEGTRVYGVTLRNGTGTEQPSGTGPRYFGGGVWAFDAIAHLENCVLENNSQGAIVTIDSSLTVESCVVRDNFDRGGMSIDGSATICDSMISGNTVGAVGSGISVGNGSDATIDSCIVEGNLGGIATGGGLSNTGTVAVLDTDFVGNVGMFVGGGLDNLGGSGEFTNCRFIDNFAGNGGAAYILAETDKENLFTSCLFVGNDGTTGAAVRVDGPGLVQFHRCTFADNNDGDAVTIGSDPTPYTSVVELDSCIVWGQGIDSLEPGPEGTITAEYCVIEGRFDGVGNLDEDPLFVDAGSGDFSLLADSPCIDAGNPSAPLDPDGTIADIGARYVRQSPIFRRGDVNGDSVVSSIVDSIFLLEWSFLDGDAPPCLDATDADDSGDISPLLDSLRLLQWGFADFAPPPSPGPAECGFDPDFDADGLDCEVEPDCS